MAMPVSWSRQMPLDQATIIPMFDMSGLLADPRVSWTFYKWLGGVVEMASLHMYSSSFWKTHLPLPTPLIPMLVTQFCLPF